MLRPRNAFVAMLNFIHLDVHSRMGLLSANVSFTRVLLLVYARLRRGIGQDASLHSQQYLSLRTFSFSLRSHHLRRCSGQNNLASEFQKYLPFVGVSLY